MLPSKKSHHLIAILLTGLMLASSAPARKPDDKKARPHGTPILWQEPTDIASRNLYLGPGGDAMKPDLSRVTFIKEEKGGYSTKYRVQDGSGNEWVVKLGKEAQSDTTANRLLWAVGYATEVAYLVPKVTIEGKGRFANARFEARPKNIKRADIWEWDDNPFTGTKEFQGLKVMMLIINNWDIKDTNNKILVVRNQETGNTELRYIISDLGGTLGKTGGVIGRSRNKPSDFVKAEFIEGIKHHFVEFNYNGKRRGLFQDITVEQAAWIGAWLARLSEEQIRDAFRAGNYPVEVVEIMARAFVGRVRELNNLAGQSPAR